MINSGRGIKNDKFGFTCFNFECTICTDEPFVLVALAKQVLYIQNSKEENWITIVQIQPRGVYDLTIETSTNDLKSYQQPIILCSQHNDLIN